MFNSSETFCFEYRRMSGDDSPFTVQVLFKFDKLEDIIGIINRTLVWKYTTQEHFFWSKIHDEWIEYAFDIWNYYNSLQLKKMKKK